jgi:hypothetical protein
MNHTIDQAAADLKKLGIPTLRLLVEEYDHGLPLYGALTKILEEKLQSLTTSLSLLMIKLEGIRDSGRYNMVLDSQRVIIQVQQELNEYKTQSSLTDRDDTEVYFTLLGQWEHNMNKLNTIRV